ncbi:hypothetical protein [Halolamina sediminis]|uniref:hypothetical protein n=1 Tax=Halolamina sediminis TaxID=1480675 RepID=UPI0006B4CBDA|nr:hypothetical protein [Halolamina sediminis]
MDWERLLNGLLTVAAVAAAAAALGVVFVAGPVDPAAVAMLGLCAAFFGASAFARVRAHPAYGVLNAGYVTVLFALWYLVVDASPGLDAAVVDAIGLFAVLAAGGLVVELYSYRRDVDSRPE